MPFGFDLDALQKQQQEVQTQAEYFQARQLMFLERIAFALEKLAGLQKEEE